MIERNSRRAGKSLIEMILVIAGMSVVLTTAGQLLMRVSQAERGLRNSAALARAELRLVRDFRNDVRTATALEPLTTDAGEGIRIVSPAATVDYVAHPEAVVRTSTAEPNGREGYRLGHVSVRFDLEDDRLAIVNVEPVRSTDRRKVSSGQLQIVAAVGADRVSATIPTDESSRPPVEAARPTAEEMP